MPHSLGRRRRTKPPSRTTSPETELVWLSAQAGRPLCVCVCGLGGTTDEWVPVGPALAQVADVTAVELALGPGTRAPLTRALRCAAASRPPDRSRPPAPGRDAATRRRGGPLQVAVEALELRIAGAPDGSILIGHSMGALASLLVAAGHAHQFAGVVLTAPFLPAGRDGRSTLATTADYARHRALFLAGAARRRRDPRPETPAIGRQTRAAALGALARYGLRPTAFHAMADRVDCPVLIVHGSADHYVPPAFASAAAARHPTWQLGLIPAAGHFPHRDNPTAWLDLVGPWIQRVSSAA